MAKPASPSATKRKTTDAKGRAQTGAGRRAARRGTADTGFGFFNGRFWGAAFVLGGLLTLLSFLGTPGTVTGWWLEQLKALFGVGRYLLPILLPGFGLYLYLRSSGHARSLAPSQVGGVLLLWLVFQATAALIGTVVHAPAPGLGGWIGWVFGQALNGLLGPTFSLVALLGLALLSLVMVLGLSPEDLGGLLIAGATWMFDMTIRSAARRREREGVSPPELSWRERLRLWWAARRRPRGGLPLVNDHLEGPVTTLPPDPNLVAPITGETGPPPMRVVGGQPTVWRLPKIEHLLEDFGSGELTEEDLAERARVIEDTLQAFGVPVTVVEVNKGPVVTQFGLKPGYITRKIRGEEHRMKVRVSQIQALTNDLSLALAAAPIRIEAPVPGRNIVGLEVPNRSIALVSLRSILESEEFRRLKGPLRIALGQDVSGRAVAASLARMPHLLVAGATGSGKSVCINAIICSLLFQYTPDELRFVLVDPKRVELTAYNGIPHLLGEVITDIEKVIGILHWATKEMEQRYRDLEKAGARNIEVFNARRLAEGKPVMPYIVIVIDELADIMMSAPEEVERSLVRLAQMARAVGIHLIIATQRPSVNVVTGLIKANFPSRIAFAVTSQIDSRVILDVPGAERLLGRGDMLFMRPDSAKLARLQGAYVSDAEVNRIVRFWHGQGGSPRGVMRPLSERPVLEEMTTSDAEDEAEEEPAVQRPLWEEIVAAATVKSDRDPLYDKAVAIVRETGRASTSLLQRRLEIGYTRAARLMDMMEQDGIVGPDLGGSRGREVLKPAPSPASDDKQTGDTTVGHR